MEVNLKLGKWDDYNWRKVSFIDKAGREICLFGIWKRSDRNGTWYENDNYATNFRNMQEVKEYAKKKAIEKYSEYL